jgi:ATP-dependent RNA helicase DeaD
MSASFSELGISIPLLKGLTDLQLTVPTAIQLKTIPVVLKQAEDVVALAKTGTGKTVAFGLPLLQLIKVEHHFIQGVILVPTRELGQQIHANLLTLAKPIPALSILSLCGGTPIKPQIQQLTQPAHIIVATPGRLIDLMKREAIHLKEVRYLILDEADEMITSLKEDVDEILTKLPKNRRTLLFSATFPGTLKQLVQHYMSKHVIHLSADMATLGHQGIEHTYVVVDPIEKLDVLLHFLNSKQGIQGIIFCKTKAAVNKLAKNLAVHKFPSGALHGSLAQPIRDRIMKQFREGHLHILVATDLAARGIDVKEIAYVVHYHLPDVAETYVHRSGRTARAGAKGFSLSILQKEEVATLSNFESALGIAFKRFQKADAQSIEENNALLWAKRIFKTKPNHEISMAFKEKIHTTLHHLTKEELIDKMLTDYLRKPMVALPTANENQKRHKK